MEKKEKEVMVKKLVKSFMGEPTGRGGPMKMRKIKLKQKRRKMPVQVTPTHSETVKSGEKSKSARQVTSDSVKSIGCEESSPLKEALISDEWEYSWEEVEVPQYEYVYEYDYIEEKDLLKYDPHELIRVDQPEEVAAGKKAIAMKVVSSGELVVTPFINDTFH